MVHFENWSCFHLSRAFLFLAELIILGEILGSGSGVCVCFVCFGLSCFSNSFISFFSFTVKVLSNHLQVLLLGYINFCWFLRISGSNSEDARLTYCLLGSSEVCFLRLHFLIFDFIEYFSHFYNCLCCCFFDWCLDTSLKYHSLILISWLLDSLIRLRQIFYGWLVAWWPLDLLNLEVDRSFGPNLIFETGFLGIYLIFNFFKYHLHWLPRCLSISKLFVVHNFVSWSRRLNSTLFQFMHLKTCF